MVKPKQINLISAGSVKRNFPGKINVQGKDRRVLFGLLLLGALAFSCKEMFQVVTLTARVSEAKRKLQVAKGKLSSMQSQLVQIEKSKVELSKEENSKQQRLDFLRTTFSDQRNYSYVLVKVTPLVPEDLWINEFTISETEIQIQGTSFNPERITRFMHQLNDSRFFRNSNFSSSERQLMEGKAVYNFQITTEPVWDLLAGPVVPAEPASVQTQ